jgi:hypothetical protein
LIQARVRSGLLETLADGTQVHPLASSVSQYHPMSEPQPHIVGFLVVLLVREGVYAWSDTCSRMTKSACSAAACRRVREPPLAVSCSPHRRLFSSAAPRLTSSTKVPIPRFSAIPVDVHTRPLVTGMVGRNDGPRSRGLGAEDGVWPTTYMYCLAATAWLHIQTLMYITYLGTYCRQPAPQY